MTVNSTDNTTGIAAEAGVLEVECLDNLDDLMLARREWDSFIEDTGGDIYFITAWIQSWWKYYGEGRKLRCFLVRENGRVVAALPFCIFRLWVGPVPLNIARFVGADFTIPVFSPAIERDYEERVLSTILTWLTEKERCDAVSFSPLSGDSPIVGVSQNLCAGSGSFRLARLESRGPHTTFELPQNFDDYLAALKKRQRSNYRRDVKQLSKNFQLETRIISGREAIQKFDDFVEMHGAQWNEVGSPGHFGDWPDSEGFNRDLVEEMADAGYARFYEILGDGKVLSIQYSFVIGDKCYWRLPARDPDPELQKLGLGRIGLVKMLESIIGEGVRHVEAGPGHYEYKVKHGGRELPLQHLVFTPSSLISRLKTGLLLRWADVLHLFYYRIWINKISARLGVQRGSLWRSWIRTRL